MQISAAYFSVSADNNNNVNMLDRLCCQSFWFYQFKVSNKY